MTDNESVQSEFLRRISEIIEDNISNEQFGVSELAHKIGMSRSNLLRKIKSQTSLSASQFIRKVRLERAMELLKETSANVSEISYQVGFSSPSYFIKCFHDHYGYPPGEAYKRREDKGPQITIKPDKTRLSSILFLSGAVIAILSLSLKLLLNHYSGDQTKVKSIAVLPFENDSNDSTNLYIVNGLMESILSNLQMIEDLRVVSRTSVEQYRNNPKSVKDIAKELGVNYIVEGSGQKNGNQIFLNIQLIEAETDKHLLSEQYRREDIDVFDLQADVANNIAGKIKAVITPEEKARINKIPTRNMQAYDLFLKGRELMFSRVKDDLISALGYFNEAIALDEGFALAFANLSITYSFLDFFQNEKVYVDSAVYYADNALRLDPVLPQSLVSKATTFMATREYENALPYLEKALEFNPNSALVHNVLSDYYTSYDPNTEKYLEYALKGAELNIASNDSAETSIVYLHLANAFIQSGFIAEAEKYINRSLEFDPANLYSEYVKAFVLYARDNDLLRTKDMLVQTFKKDTTRLDVLQEVGKLYYYLRDFETSYKYYKPLMDIRRAYNLSMYNSEDSKIGLVLSEVGLKNESDSLFNKYRMYAEDDKSIYRNLSMAVYHSFYGNTDKALHYLELFSHEDNFHYWTILFLRIDPLIDKVKDNPEFISLLEKIEHKFWDYHNELKASLSGKGLI